MNPATKTYHAKNFDILKGAAANIAANLHQNPHPNKDQIENLASSFSTIDKAIKSYCTKTPGTEPVLKNYNKAYQEWELVKQGKGNSAHIVTELQAIAVSHYVAPPAPPVQAVAPPRPAAGPPAPAPAADPRRFPEAGKHRQ